MRRLGRRSALFGAILALCGLWNGEYVGAQVVSTDSADTAAPAAPATLVVLPFENRTGDSVLDALATTIHDTISLNVRLVTARGGDAAAAAGTGGGRISGYIERHQDQQLFVVVATVGDMRTGEVIHTVQEEAQSILDVFDAADRITDQVLVALAGRQVEYGGLAIAVSGEPSAVAVLLDGQHIADGAVRLQTVVAGRYTLTVVQERPLGVEQLLDTTVTVPPGEHARVSVAVSLVTPAEEQIFREADLQIRQALHRDDHSAAAGHLDEIIVLLENAGPLDRWPGLVLQHARYRQWHGDVSGFPEQPDDAAVSRETMRGARTEATASLRRYLDYVFPQDPVELPGIAAIGRFRGIPFRTITVDGDTSDWEGIQPVLTGFSAGQYRDGGNPRRATTIEAVYLAQDQQYLYLRFVVADGPITSATFPSFAIWLPLNAYGDHMLCQVERWDSWQTGVIHWDHGRWHGNRLAQGTMRMSGNEFEARFPRRHLDQFLQLGRTYQITAKTSTRDSQHDWNSLRVHDRRHTSIVY